MIKTICPVCGSDNMILLYPDNDIWLCKNCNYKGKPVKIDEKYIEYYKASKEIAKKLL